MSLDSEDQTALILPLLQHVELCANLGRDELRQVAETVRLVTFRSGDVICRQDQPGDSMYVVVKGRVKLSLEQGGSEFQLLEYLGRGQHFGEMAVLTDGDHPATATALMDTELLELGEKDFQRLMTTVPGFAANLSRSLGFRMRHQASGKRRRRMPKVVALMATTPRTEAVAPLVAQALTARGNSVQLLSERTDTFLAGGDWHLEGLFPGASRGERSELIRERIQQAVERHDKVILSLNRDDAALLRGVLPQCEESWWLIDSEAIEEGKALLLSLLREEPALAPRIRVVWILPPDGDLGPLPLKGLGLAERDFRVVLAEDPQVGNRNQRMGIARLMRHLQGFRLGLALSGGGARGLSHLGVLRGLEKAGIDFDLLAGTSSGALLGMSYASGWSPEKAIEEFRQALTPHRLVRALPAGSHWYLWFMFRTGGWNRKLRPYLGEGKLEQTQIPFSTVTADLVSGQAIVRDTGDIIDAVLESINFPPVARPILRDGMALIDGAVLNNLPADVLPPRGADLIVGVNVVAKFRPKFAGNTSDTPTEKMRRPRTIETLWRVSELQDHGVGTLRAGAVDLMISPETAGFEFADFSQGIPLADVGEAAADEAVPQLKRMIADLEKNE